MPNRSHILRVGSFLLLPCLLAEAQQKPASSQTSSDTNSKPPAAKSAVVPNSTSTPKASAPARRRPVRRSAAAPVRQLRPTRERYTEIQQSLAKAGHFSEPANGVWGDSSVNALQEFQGAQGLQPTGKIDAPTLIRLGLGPNYESPQETASPGATSSR